MERASGPVDSTAVDPLPGVSVTGKGEDTSTPSFEGTWMTQPHQQLDEFHRHVEQPMKKLIGAGGHRQ